jgi:LPS export ABC transporter protein LptC
MIVRILVVLGIGAAIGALIYLWRVPGGSVIENPAAETEGSEPGYTAVGARLLEIGDDGQPLYRLNAERVEQPEPGGDIVVTEPRVVYDPAVGSPWTLRAARGVLPPDARQAQLDGDVEVKGIPSGSTAMVTIKTTSLHLDVNRQLATSPELVRIDWAGSRLAGRGLRADLKSNDLRLATDVHGEAAR